MKLYAIYGKGYEGPAAERAWYGPADGYYDYTGWPEAVSKTPSLRMLTKLSKAFEVAGADSHEGKIAYAVRDEDYLRSQMELQYGNEFCPGVHHTVPTVRVAAIFTDEKEAKAAYPKAEIRSYKIGW
jgi:hypothetical protein